MGPKRCPFCGKYSENIDHCGMFSTVYKCDSCNRYFSVDKPLEEEVVFKEKPKERETAIDHDDVLNVRILLETTENLEEFISYI